MRDLKQTFNAVYREPIGEDDQLWYGSQTATVMALRFGLVPEEELRKVVGGLVHDIEVVNNGHHTVGIHGNRYLYTVLTDHGQKELAYRVLTTPDFPSQAFVLKTGFTTWPERQFDWSTGIEFSNSLNHPMHSGFAAYFYERLGGIRPLAESPGYKQFIVDPVAPGVIDHADTRIRTPYGEITNQWVRQGEDFTMTLSVPFNATATLPLTTATLGTVRVNGESLSVTEKVLTLGSGTYIISYDL